MRERPKPAIDEWPLRRAVQLPEAVIAKSAQNLCGLMTAMRDFSSLCCTGTNGWYWPAVSKKTVVFGKGLYN